MKALVVWNIVLTVALAVVIGAGLMWRADLNFRLWEVSETAGGNLHDVMSLGDTFNENVDLANERADAVEDAIIELGEIVNGHTEFLVEVAEYLNARGE